ncbi:MAG: 2-C-methyl-D-erythritol 4-phosphate cytidylyltransferase [Clostridiales bacterium]|nr:2-C-methyl-D-erythritol 4-phosphate cytidylyltransferase [Clostridiales bacterium]
MHIRNVTGQVIDWLRTLTGRDKPFTSAIIVAAGSGTRMEDPTGRTKQLIELCGQPIAVRTLVEFEKSDYIDEIILVTRKDEKEIFRSLIERYGIKKIRAIAKGGDTRQQSVLSGFSKISSNSKYVAIHDGARCLITQEMIGAVVATAYSCGAAVAGCRIYDTVKIADSSGLVMSTLDRDKLWLAQTPQVFKSDLYRAAAYTALEDGYTATDDCALVERIGNIVKMVDCGPENLKITTPRDISYAAFLLKQRKADNEE